jgi:hypothetical protein
MFRRLLRRPSVPRNDEKTSHSSSRNEQGIPLARGHDSLLITHYSFSDTRVLTSCPYTKMTDERIHRPFLLL